MTTTKKHGTEKPRNGNIEIKLKGKMKMVGGGG